MRDRPALSASFAEALQLYAQDHPPALRYDGRGDIREWQERFRPARLDGLRGPLPDRLAPAAEVVETVELPTHTRQTLMIPVTAWWSLPAYLLVPRNIPAGQKRAGLLALHGHHDFGAQSVAGFENAETAASPHVAYGRSAVEAGFVVLVPAWWGWPMRNGHNVLVGARDKCNVIQMAAGMFGLNVLTMHMLDAQAALDVLAGRAEVDPRRIGCLGNSYGGRTAMWIAIHDRRIACCCSAGAMNTFAERSGCLSSCGIQYPFGLLQYGDVPELYSLIAPRPLQLMAGAADALITPDDRDAMLATVRMAYRQAGAAENLSYVLHDDGHVLHWRLAEDFFRRHLDQPA